MRFDKKILPAEIRAFLKTEGIASAYSISTQISDWLEENPSPGVNTLLCAAHYAWACALLTELDDDIIDFGEEAISYLQKVLESEPGNEEALKQKSKLEKKIKKAKRGREEILKWEKEDVNEMSRGVLDELAFYYFEKAEKKPEFAEKGYRYYQKIYEYDLEETELPQSSLYHFATMAYCKYYAEGYASAKDLIDQTLNWELNEKFRIYDFKITNVWMIQLNYLCNRDDFPGFQQSFENWYEKMKVIRPEQEPYSFDYRNLTPIVKWLFDKDEREIRHYILTHCYPFLLKKKINLDDQPSVLMEIKKR